MAVKRKIRRALSAAEEVRSIREGLGMNRERFAVELHTSYRSVQRWEEGRPIMLGTLERIRELARRGVPSTSAPVPSFSAELPAPGSPEDLHEMLDIILERAPQAMKDSVAEFLFERAGRYGWFKSPPALAARKRQG